MCDLWLQELLEEYDVFQCPGVGPSVCDSAQGSLAPWGTSVSMPRCGAFGVRLLVGVGSFLAGLMFQCPGVGPSVCDIDPDKLTDWVKRFNAPVWGLRCATTGKSISLAPWS